MMGRVHAARIHWSAGQISRGLPGVPRTIDPAWFADAGSRSEEGWSLVCDFDVPAAQQGDPSAARVHLLVDEAPHDRLRPGASLRLFERATQQHARVEILD